MNTGKPETLVDKESDRRNHDEVKYFIAACVLGAAVGNIFIARRFKHNMKTSYRTERSSYSQKFWDRPPHEKYQERNAEKSSGRKSSYDSNRTTNSSKPAYDEDYLTPKLRLLGITNSYNNISKEAIKNAYRDIALSCHPDRISPESTNRQELENRFRDASIAYKEILTYIEKKHL